MPKFLYFTFFITKINIYSFFITYRMKYMTQIIQGIYLFILYISSFHLVSKFANLLHKNIIYKLLYLLF